MYSYWHHVLVIFPSKRMSLLSLSLYICRDALGPYIAGCRLELTDRRLAVESILTYFHFTCCTWFCFAIFTIQLTQISCIYYSFGKWIVKLSNAKQYENPFISVVLHSYCTHVCNILLKGSYTLTIYILTSLGCSITVVNITLVGYVPCFLRAWESVARIVIHHLLLKC